LNEAPHLAAREALSTFERIASDGVEDALK
jgi:hypothetical protein